jgi:hypothetical protein
MGAASRETSAVAIKVRLKKLVRRECMAAP